MKIIKNIIVVVMGLFIVFTIYKNIFTDSRVEYFERKYLEREYQGVLVKKYINLKSHAAKVLVLSNGYEEYLPFSIYDMYNEVNVGDSMFKARGDSMVYVLKKDSTIMYNYLNIK